MKTPQLNQRLILEAPMRQSDGAGGFLETWTPIGAIWAEMVARAGGEATQTGAPVSKASYKITVRGAPVGNPRRPIAEQRFRNGARVFSIQAVLEKDTHGKYLTCFAQEEVAT